MKLVCISDTHRMYKRINVPKGDVFIHAGDIEIYNCLSELRDFNKWLDSLPHKHKIVIAGNHDRFFYQTDTDKIQKMFFSTVLSVTLEPLG